MSKKMTPCEKLGYKVGDEFEVIRHHAFKKGQTVTLHEDDGTECPLFAGDGGGAGVFDGVECSFATLNKHVRKIANKLKPAKQALTDAINQNGGWPKECHWVFSTSNGFGSAFCWTNKPKRSGWNWLGGGKFTLCCEIGSSLPNWHQTILSRDEYFTAYPEQVKVEVENETKHKVEAEMTSESEMTINVSSAGAVAGGDWHKSGELPPVGEVCEVMHLDRWVCCEVIAHFEQSWGMVAAYTVGINGGNAKLLEQCNAEDFRPLRTEREKAIDKMVSLVEPLATYREFAGAIYDAGMYKEVN